MTTPIVVSYSELDTFRQCPLKHFVLYGQRWTKPKKKDSALNKGSLWHAVMEAHYNVIRQAQLISPGNRIPLDAEKAVLNQAWEAVKPLLYHDDRDEVEELIEWMYEGYVKLYGIDRQWLIKAVEHQIITPLLDARGHRSRYHIKCKMDLVIFDRETSGLWVVDHKSGGNLPTDMELAIDDQFGLYTWAMRRVKRPVVGSIHSAARTQRNKSPMSLDSRMSRTYLNRGDKELTNLALDAYWTAYAAHPPKSVPRARYSSPDPRQCGWKCDIKEPHLLARTGRSMQSALMEYDFRIDRTRH